MITAAKRHFQYLDLIIHASYINLLNFNLKVFLRSRQQVCASFLIMSNVKPTTSHASSYNSALKRAE